VSICDTLYDQGKTNTVLLFLFFQSSGVSKRAICYTMETYGDLIFKHLNSNHTIFVNIGCLQNTKYATIIVIIDTAWSSCNFELWKLPHSKQAGYLHPSSWFKQINHNRHCNYCVLSIRYRHLAKPLTFHIYKFYKKLCIPGIWQFFLQWT